MTVDDSNNNSISIVDEMRFLEKEGSLFPEDMDDTFNSENNLENCKIIFENLHEGIVLISENNRKIFYVNKKAAECIGLQKKDIIGKNCDEFICSFDQSKEFNSTEGKKAQKQILITDVGEEKLILKESTSIVLDGRPFILFNFIPLDFIEKRKDEELVRKKQLLNYQKILLNLSKKQFQSFTEGLEYINEKIAETLNIARCGFWLFNKDHSQIICKDTYLKQEKSHEQNMILHSKNFPHYFKALEEELVIDAPDAVNDLRTKEFKETYLEPLHIVSMFDFPVRLHGKLIGIICCEHNQERRLNDDETRFVKSMADYVSLQYEKQNRIKVEQELKESKKQTDAILEAAADGIRIINSDFKIISANKTMEKLSKSKDKEIIGRYCYNVLSSDFCGTDECSLRKVIKTKKGFIRESIRKTNDGNNLHCLEVVKPYKDDKGNIIGIIEDIRDITSLKRTQQQLIKEKKKAQEYLDVATVIIIVLDNDGQVLLINKRGCETLGYKEEELVGTNWFEIVSPTKDVIRQQEMFQSYMKGEISFPANEFNEVVTKNGEKRIIKWNSTKIYDESGKQTKMLSSGEDITEAIKAKEAKRKADDILEKRNKAFRILYDTALGVENQPKRKVIELLCNNFLKISGSQKGILGIYTPQKDLFSIYRFDLTKDLDQFCECKLSTEQISHEFLHHLSHDEIRKYTQISNELSIILSDEFYKDFQLYNKTLYQISKPLANDSVIIGFVVKNNNEKLEMKDMIDTYLNFTGIIIQRIQSLEDLAASEKRYKKLSNELEETVEQRTAHIQKLLKQKDAFINQLGHDLKHPINPLINLLPILEKKNTDSQCQEILTVLKRNTGYMKNLIIKTIKFAQLNAPSTEFSFEKVNLYNEINLILEKQQILFKQQNVDVINNVEKNIIASIDKLHFSELIDNLLNNAVKYNTENGKVTIEGYHENDSIIVSVKDTGIGMTREQLDHIFDEFYKADPARHDFDSSGLGMSICKRIVEKHGGEIWVESPGTGRGTTVRFNIPLNH